MAQRKSRKTTEVQIHRHEKSPNLAGRAFQEANRVYFRTGMVTADLTIEYKYSIFIIICQVISTLK